VSLIKAAQAHARYSVVDAFVAGVKEGHFSPPVRRILSQLCELFLIYWVMERSGDFILVCKLVIVKPSLAGLLFSLLHLACWIEQRTNEPVAVKLRGAASCHPTSSS